MSPRPRLVPMSEETARDRAGEPVVSLMRLAVAMKASGTTRFKIRTGVIAMTVTLQATLRLISSIPWPVSRSMR